MLLGKLDKKKTKNYEKKLRRAPTPHNFKIYLAWNEAKHQKFKKEFEVPSKFLDPSIYYFSFVPQKKQ